MDIRKLQGFDISTQKLTPAITPAITPTTSPRGDFGPVGDVTFKEALSKLTGATTPTTNIPQIADRVKFSNHAVDRMRMRGITYGPEDIAKLNEAVSKADAKGAKNSLVLMNDSALIVSVKNKTVVTVMDKNALKENVFTNIDSTIVM